MLTGKNKRYLRSLGNKTKTILQIGKDGLTNNTFKSIDDAFNTHELIKINLLKTCTEDIKEISEKIVKKNKCELVQILGKTILLYKKAEEPKIIFK